MNFYISLNYLPEAKFSENTHHTKSVQFGEVYLESFDPQEVVTLIFFKIDTPNNNWGRNYETP